MDRMIRTIKNVFQMDWRDHFIAEKAEFNTLNHLVTRSHAAELANVEWITKIPVCVQDIEHQNYQYGWDFKDVQWGRIINHTHHIGTVHTQAPDEGDVHYLNAVGCRIYWMDLDPTTFPFYRNFQRPNNHYVTPTPAQVTLRFPEECSIVK